MLFHASSSRAVSLAVAARRLSTTVEPLTAGRGIVWGRGSLGLRPNEGFARQLDKLSMAALKPTPMNTLVDTPIEQVRCAVRQCVGCCDNGSSQLAFSGTGGAAITQGGKLWTWGTNKYVIGLGGQITGVPVPRPVKTLAGVDITKVALGENHGAAISKDGMLFTWGYGGFPLWTQGALGHGDRVDQFDPALVEFFESEKLRVADVHCGKEHTLVLTTDGRCWAFGEGESGLLGSGILAAAAPREVDFGESSVRCTRIACGSGFSLALDEQNRLWGWGKNGYGQLGLGEDAALDINAAESIPVVIGLFPKDESAIVDIAAGGRCSIALGGSGRVYVWGDRLHMRPFHVAHFEEEDMYETGEKAVRIAAGVGSYGILTSKGRVFTFGKASFSGATGQGLGAASVKPALVKGLEQNEYSSVILGGSTGAVIVGPPPQEPRRPLDLPERQ
jgi:alpha-tubulin suppressor-like RCC1 family protein